MSTKMRRNSLFAALLGVVAVGGTACTPLEIIQITTAVLNLLKLLGGG